MPTIILLYGIRFFFYKFDHEPVHIHVSYQDFSAKIQILPEIKVVENNGIKAQTMKKALEIVNEQKDYIISEWNKTVNDRN